MRPKDYLANFGISFGLGDFTLELRLTCIARRTSTNRTGKTVSIQCVRIPADGSPPHLLILHTISTGRVPAPDWFLGHIPDVRRYWPTPNAWTFRDHCRRVVAGEQVAGVDGVYYAFTSFALDDLPRSTSFPSTCGDAFIAKVSGPSEPMSRDGAGWVDYLDVQEDFLESDAFRRWMKLGVFDENGETIRRPPGCPARPERPSWLIIAAFWLIIATVLYYHLREDLTFFANSERGFKEEKI